MVSQDPVEDTVEDTVENNNNENTESPGQTVTEVAQNNSPALGTKHATMYCKCEYSFESELVVNDAISCPDCRADIDIE